MRYLRGFYFDDIPLRENIGRLEFAPVTVFCSSNTYRSSALLDFILQNLFTEFFHDEYSKVWHGLDWYYTFKKNCTLYNSGDFKLYKMARSWNNICEKLYTDKVNAVFDIDENDNLLLPTNVLMEKNIKYISNDYCCNISGMSIQKYILMMRPDYSDYNLCILDMPEFGLSVYEERRLVKYIEECSRLHSVQFIIATQSPVITSIKEAFIYDMDVSPIKRTEWEDVSIVKEYIRFFEEIK